MGHQDGRHHGRTYGRGRDRFSEDRSSDGYWQGHYGDAQRYGAPPPDDYEPEGRGFFNRAGDEVRRWFGDEEAERRRAYDAWFNRRYGDPRDQSSRLGFASANSASYRPNQGYAPFTGQDSGQMPDQGYHYRPSADVGYGAPHDSHYHSWRQDRIAELDRDYAEYRRENRARFDNDFGNWRSRRKEQRAALAQVREHMAVVGSDGDHVGTVDKVCGDRIILTRTDRDAGGIHHAIPCGWIDMVGDDRVTLEKTAAQAYEAWHAEQEQQAMFGDRDCSDETLRGGPSRGGADD
ncbi:DUF2171 domain-containing protein [Sphingobium aquiterrae]|uniref:DUF2171 domain-containing protein n=1 Tax=Sphingobium aquiterrae TaxID=2038656 RepID=UPI00301A138C